MAERASQRRTGPLPRVLGPSRALSLAACSLALAACGSENASSPPTSVPPIGLGAEYHPQAVGPAVARGVAVAGLRCTRGGPRRFGVHLEVFANRRVVIVPPGIGVAPPQRRSGAYVVAGRCSYPARTLEPTGVIQVAPGRAVTLGQFFALWGQPLRPTALVGFRTTGKARVLAFVGGQTWRGDPRGIPLARHAQIVVEIGGYIPPHRRYRFRQGL